MSVAAIPNGYENLLISRTVTKIKQTMFSGSNHIAICRKMEELSTCIAKYDSDFADLTSFKLPPTPMIAKLKPAQRNLKSIRCYSCTVHGVNLILDRLPGQPPRNKCTIVREYRGCQ